ncbi:M28 family peptidase [Argonema antarcticum]|uniref:M28 family peptidase n=1 Tax=Argonema antarcticum TaxID=2942763 RepID=UPI002010D265|nr:M28 family peptidase [Argonema antarcticum]MCL1472395.1 M28 family peptidase [Argonema antarcticum A004/B2]
MPIKKSIWVALPIIIVAVVMIQLHNQFSNTGDRTHPTQGTGDWGLGTSVNQKTANNKTENKVVAQTPQTVVAPPLSAKRLLAHIKALARERYTEADRTRTRNYITQVLKASGWSPTLQSFQGGVNVVAQRSGRNPEAGTILLAAHYDTVKGSPGADDNASGVATVLEVARVLGKRQTPRTLQVAFFDLEEKGLIGSLAFTNNAANLTDLQGAIVLDMVGFACHTPGCQRYPQGLPITPPSDKGDFLAVLGDAEHLPLLNSFRQSNQPELPPVLMLPIPLKGLGMLDVLRSDHAPFWYRGIGAVFVTDTANFRSPHYHRSSDTLETIDRKFFLGSATIVANATATLLESRENLATARLSRSY